MGELQENLNRNARPSSRKIRSEEESAEEFIRQAIIKARESLERKE